MRSAIQVRQESSTCGSNSGTEPYNLSLQIGALFIILTVSASACAFPLIAARVPCLKIPLKFLFVVRHFGTGVLIATAFVHLLPTAFTSLTDPCLPPFWNESYPAFTGAIALASVFIITSIEMLLSPGRKCCSMPKNEETAQTSNAPGLENIDDQNAAQLGPLHGRKKPGRSHSNGRGLARMISAPPRTMTDAIENHPRRNDSFEETKPDNNEFAIDDAEIGGSFEFTPEQKRKKASMQCILLEIGILFHSVFIGMSLAVSTGGDLTVLLIAITFHQLFEGLALGSRIATVPWGDKHKFQPWLMAVAYGCTTPIGQAIGIATSDLYDPASMTGLLVVGIMNAISAGLLTYTSLVDLLCEDFLSDESWKTLQGNKRIIAFALVVMGAFLMSLIGAWA